MSGELVIDVRGLTKAFSGRTVVDDFDLQVPKGAIYYLGLNQKNEYLARPEVREALKWLVDYDGIAGTIVKGSAVVHQSFLPQGF